MIEKLHFTTNSSKGGTAGRHNFLTFMDCHSTTNCHCWLAVTSWQPAPVVTALGPICAKIDFSALKVQVKKVLNDGREQGSFFKFLGRACLFISDGPICSCQFGVVFRIAPTASGQRSADSTADS